MGKRNADPLPDPADDYDRKLLADVEEHGMTEQEWLECDDPTLMMKIVEGKTSPRKLRLLACGSCRRLWPTIRFRETRKAVEVAERFADREVSEQDMLQAGDKARRNLRFRSAGILPLVHSDDKGIVTTSQDLEALTGPLFHLPYKLGATIL